MTFLTRLAWFILTLSRWFVNQGHRSKFTVAGRKIRCKSGRCNLITEGFLLFKFWWLNSPKFTQSFLQRLWFVEYLRTAFVVHSFIHCLDVLLDLSFLIIPHSTWPSGHPTELWLMPINGKLNALTAAVELIDDVRSFAERWTEIQSFVVQI